MQIKDKAVRCDAVKIYHYLCLLCDDPLMRKPTVIPNCLYRRPGTVVVQSSFNLQQKPQFSDLSTTVTKH